MTSRIALVHARQIWDSRGRPTVEVDLTLDTGACGRAAAPAGASRGDNEAIDLRDGGTAFGGYGVVRAVSNVNGEIAAALKGALADQAEVDATLASLDGTPNFARLGGNAVIAASLALLNARAAQAGLSLWEFLAADRTVSLPLPEIQIFGGGAHAGRRTDIQDFMVMAPEAGTLRRALEITADVYRAAGQLMADHGKLAGTADEGGWWPAFSSNEEGLGYLTRAIERAGYRAGAEVFISLDIAASEFYRDGAYRMVLDDMQLESGAMVERVRHWCATYPILSIEDPVSQHDTDGMRAVTQSLGGEIQIVGDDFLVTDANRVEQAARNGTCNCALIKVNQAGTVTRAKVALEAAQKAGWSAIVSARSGETEDVFLSHLATGWNAGQIKVGSFARSERMAKWNELLRIEEALGTKAVFAGWSAFPASLRR
jgi:enolase